MTPCEFTWAGWEVSARAHGWAIHEHHEPVDEQGRMVGYHYQCPSCHLTHWAIPACEASGTAAGDVETRSQMVNTFLAAGWSVSPVAHTDDPANPEEGCAACHNRSVASASAESDNPCPQ